jgi:ubiquinone/menaquinone biosynthesis C-methylase UbiE
MDVVLEAMLRVGSRFPNVSNPPGTLAVQRREQALALARRARPAVDELSTAVLASEPSAVARYDELISSTMADLRRSRPTGFRERCAAALDRAFYRNIQEFMDDPAYPMASRIHQLDRLDRLNQHLGSYEAWAKMLGPLLSKGGRKPVRVHDLASGHGGFARALKRRMGRELMVTASDLKDEYLDIGRERAKAEKLDVHFERLDATDLSAVDDVDVFVCTQSLHHFPSGMVARMLAQAARAAKVGVTFIDGERGLVPMLLMTSIQTVYSRSWSAIHDTYATFRRMPLAEELFLLGLLAPGSSAAAAVDFGRRAPGYAYVSIGSTAR